MAKIRARNSNNSKQLICTAKRLLPPNYQTSIVACDATVPHISDSARQIPTHIIHLLLSVRVSRLDVAVDACLKDPAATVGPHSSNVLLRVLSICSKGIKPRLKKLFHEFLGRCIQPMIFTECNFYFIICP